MSNFDSTKKPLKAILEEIVDGKIQLPDFQRGWVWDDEHIRSLLVSIGRSFPIGSIMLLETGGSARFQVRPVEGLTLPTGNIHVERLILDGQQRLTALTQVLRLQNPIKTKNAQKQEVTRFYYIDIEKALLGNGNIEDAIIGVDQTKQLKTNFGRDIALDLSTIEKEFEEFYFPCNQILNSDEWEQKLVDYDPRKLIRYMNFRTAVMSKFRDYEIPIIELKKENSKEAVCLVFEKVNTGGVALSVFELMTATYAADGFNLRDDWYGSAAKGMQGRYKQMISRALLRGIEPTDFLQGISLLFTFDQRKTDLINGKTGKDVTAVSAKREQVLSLPLIAYQQWADKLVTGFFEVDRFLRRQGFKKIDYLPYRSQLIPFACVMVHLRERWLEPVIHQKLEKWFWCGVFGEMYGGSNETRIALDMQDLLAGVDDPKAPEPATIVAAGFQASRLDTLRTRTSAAYRGLYILLQRQRSKDFFWKTDIIDLDHEDCKIDIHHIFPVAWCNSMGISDRIYNSIINKTAISYKANRMIGGAAPSVYLDQLCNHAGVHLTTSEQDRILQTHKIDPISMRSNKFEDFYAKRKSELLQLIEEAMGKTIVPISGVASLYSDEEADDEAND